jgi:hypothetical protein
VICWGVGVGLALDAAAAVINGLAVGDCAETELRTTSTLDMSNKAQSHLLNRVRRTMIEPRKSSALDEFKPFRIAMSIPCFYINLIYLHNQLGSTGLCSADIRLSATAVKDPRPRSPTPERRRPLRAC